MAVDNPIVEKKIVFSELLDELRRIVVSSQVWVDPEKLEAYSHDETDAKTYGHMPDAVVFPKTVEEVSEIVKLANRHRFPLIPRGAGSGLSGGAGMVTNDFARAVEEKGLFYAGYPMSLETCCIGGNIAENAGGGKAIKYGVTGRYILGIELVTPRGDVVWLGGKLSKDVTGYDLKSIIIGSEGTLGIVTKAIVTLIGLPTA